VFGTATWRRKSSPPETTNTPTVGGALVRPIAESLDVLARRRTDADGDQRLHFPAECGEVGLGVVAADHAALAQGADPLERGRRRNVDGLSDRAVRAKGVALQFAQNRRIKFAQLDHFGSPVE
jgi:hypothetical protein